MAEPDQIVRFYDSLLGLESLSENLQRRILAVGLKEQAWELLEELAGRDDLGAGVDDRLGEIDRARIRCAWLARPGRSAADIADMLRGETRVSVLAAIAARPGLPAAAYDTVAARMGSLKVAVALLENHDVGRRARRRAAEYAVDNYANSSGHSQAGHVCNSLKAADGVADVVLSRARHMALLKLDLKGDPSTESVAKAISRCLDGIDREAARARPASNHTVNNIVLWCTTLKQLLARYEAETATLDEAEHRLGEISARAADTKIDKILSGLTDGAANLRERMAKRDHLAAVARTSSDSDELAEVAKSLERPRAADHLDYSIVHQALLANPHTPVQALDRTMEVCGWALLRNGLDSLLARTDAALALGRHWPNMLTDDVIGRAPDPEKLFCALLCDATERDDPRSQQAVNEYARSRHMTAELVAELPASAIRPSAPAALLDRVSTLVDEALGDEPVAWETFEAMVGTFTGSLSELLTVCGQVCDTSPRR